MTSRSLAMVIVLATVAVTAQDADDGTRTITGELVEMMCYQRIDDDALGQRHAECALKCAVAGMDLAILSTDGPYIVTGDAAGTDELFAFIANTVRATGTVDDSGGRLLIDIGFTESTNDDDEDEGRPQLMIEEVESPVP